MQKTALITGGAKRIGKEIALYLASLGYNIALNFHSSLNDALSTKSEIEKFGISCELFKCDLTNEDEVIKLIENVKNHFNGLDVLINNASAFYESTIKNSGVQIFNNIFNINFKAPYLLTYQFAKIIKKGNIINLLDAKIIEKNIKFSLYNLSKKMLEEFTLLSAKELRPEIRVNAVSPGFVLEPSNNNNNFFLNMLKNRTIAKKGKIEDINKAIEFLLNNEYVNGQIIYIDGGLHLG